MRRPRGSAGRWLSIFAASFRLFLIRFLVPVPVGQADNRDGPRLMRGLGGGKRADTVAMAGSNLATLLAFTLSIALAASMGYRPGAPAGGARGSGRCSRRPGCDRVGGGSLCPAWRAYINVGNDPLSLLVC